MYTYISQFDSPNYTPAGQTRSVWGRDRNIEAIAIHWWGDPSTNPSFEGVVNYLCRPNGASSAHFVATGTDRRVACIVAPSDNAWATNNANPYTIAIECDPRCRDEDYDVVAELVAELRATYGNLPLVPHKQFAQTSCPGNYDLNRINQIAATKVARAEDQFGMAKDKVDATKKYVTLEQVTTLYNELLERQPDQGGIDHYVGHYTYDFVRNDIATSTEYVTLQNRKAEAQKAAVEAAKREAERIAKEQADKEAKRIADEKAAQEAAQAGAAERAAQYAKENNDLLKQIIAFLKKIFNLV